MGCFSDKKEKIPLTAKRLGEFAALLLSAAVVGVICGAVGGAFAESIGFVTALRAEYPWLIYILPFGGLVSVALYKLARVESIGTDRVLESVRGESETPVLLAPVVFAASVITHLFGGSAGKEGAALQIGSGVAELVSKITKADSKRRSVLTVCGMAALFSAVFGTPVAACIFAAEVAVLGRIDVVAALPALVSSVAAHMISLCLGVEHESFHLDSTPAFGAVLLIKIIAVAAITALVSVVFCWAIRRGKKLFENLFRNAYVRIFAGGCLIVVMTLILGTDYNGGGMFVIERIFEEGVVRPEAFLLKILFTVITVSAGYKGGEIVPSFFIGATLAAVLSPVFGLSAEFGAAIGMVAFFGGVTNCPVASSVIGIELFGSDGILFFALAAFTARAFSGKASLYRQAEKTLV